MYIIPTAITCYPYPKNSFNGQIFAGNHPGILSSVLYHNCWKDFRHQDFPTLTPLVNLRENGSHSLPRTSIGQYDLPVKTVLHSTGKIENP